jgi:hypothetical protein
MDKRKEKLQSDILTALIRSNTFEEFEKLMNANGFEVIKGRGIAFSDRQKVYTKGSQVGYSLAAIMDQLISQRKSQSFLKKKDLNTKTHKMDRSGPNINKQNVFRSLLKQDIESEYEMLLPKKPKKKSGLSI